jgi:hypothetical protein
MPLPEEITAASKSDLGAWPDARVSAALALCGSVPFENDNEWRVITSAASALRAEQAERAARARHRQAQIMQFCILAAAAARLQWPR